MNGEVSSIPFAAAAEAELRRAGSLNGAPSFVRRLQAEAADWFRQHGLPNRSDEAWRYTPLGRIAEVPFAPAAAIAPGPFDSRALGRQLAPSGFGCEPAHQAFLVNGRCMPPSLSEAGIELVSLAQAMRQQPALLEPYLGRVAGREHAFGALNAALFQDGILLRVPPGACVELPVHLGIVQLVNRAAVDYPRILLIVGAGARLSLVEWHLALDGARFLSASVAEVILEPGASLEHTRILRGNDAAHRVGIVAVRQAEGTAYHSRVFTLGTAFSRLDLGVQLGGEGAEATLEALYHLGSAEYVDHHTTLDHLSGGTTSQQNYRGIVDRQAHAVFDGTVFVRRGAQRTKAHQQNHHLVLSDEAVVDSKPRLEIDADDVQCGHGAAVGKLDEEQLFYLRSRGLPAAVARAWLVRAFASDLLGRIPSLALRGSVEQALTARLGIPH